MLAAPAEIRFAAPCTGATAARGVTQSGRGGDAAMILEHPLRLGVGGDLAGEGLILSRDPVGEGPQR